MEAPKIRQIHPMFVHFPQALFPVAFGAFCLYFATGVREFEAGAFVCALFGLLAAPVTAATAPLAPTTVVACVTPCVQTYPTPAITPPAKILIVSPAFDDSTYLAGRNVSWVQLVTAADVNIEQLLLAKSVILVGDALTTLANRTA